MFTKANDYLFLCGRGIIMEDYEEQGVQQKTTLPNACDHIIPLTNIVQSDGGKELKSLLVSYYFGTCRTVHDQRIIIYGSLDFNKLPIVSVLRSRSRP